MTFYHRAIKEASTGKCDRDCLEEVDTFFFLYSALCSHVCEDPPRLCFSAQCNAVRSWELQGCYGWGGAHGWLLHRLCPQIWFRLNLVGACNWWKNTTVQRVHAWFLRALLRNLFLNPGWVQEHSASSSPPRLPLPSSESICNISWNVYSLLINIGSKMTKMGLDIDPDVILEWSLDCVPALVILHKRLGIPLTDLKANDCLCGRRSWVNQI